METIENIKKRLFKFNKSHKDIRLDYYYEPNIGYHTIIVYDSDIFLNSPAINKLEDLFYVEFTKKNKNLNILITDNQSLIFEPSELKYSTPYQSYFKLELNLSPGVEFYKDRENNYFNNVALCRG